MEWHSEIEDEEPAERPRDPTVDRAKDALRAHFRDNLIDVNYFCRLAAIILAGS